MRQTTNLRIPGPTPVPADVLEAVARPMVDHRGREFAALIGRVAERLKEVYLTKQDVLLLSASGTGGLEAAVVNTLSPGDRVLAVSIGAFGDRFAAIAETFGADVTVLPYEWGQAVRGAARLLLVDAVSSLGAIPLDTDGWALDVVVTGSQKGWMVPPGLAFICLSERAWKANESARMPR